MSKIKFLWCPTHKRQFVTEPKDCIQCVVSWFQVEKETVKLLESKLQAQSSVWAAVDEAIESFEKIRKIKSDDKVHAKYELANVIAGIGLAKLRTIREIQK